MPVTSECHRVARRSITIEMVIYHSLEVSTAAVAHITGMSSASMACSSRLHHVKNRIISTIDATQCPL